jgi:hypothetical protein
LFKDIDTQILLLQSLPSPSPAIKEDLEKAMQIDEETLRQIQ